MKIFKSLIFRIILSLIFFIPSYIIANEADSLKRLLPGVRGTERIDVLYYLGNRELTSNLEECIQYNFQAIQEAEIINYTRGIVRAKCNLAEVYQDQNNYFEAFKNATQALELAENSHDTSGHVRAILVLSDIYSQLHKFSKTRNLLSTALELSEHLKCRISRQKTYVKLGTLYKELQINDSAAFYFNEALLQFNNCRVNSIRLTVYMHLSDLAATPDEAIQFINLALRFMEETGYDKIKGTLFTKLSFQYSRKGDLEKAFRYSRMALKDREKHHMNLVSSSWINLGSLYLRINKYDSAVFCFQTGADIALERKDFRFLKSANKKLYELYNQAGQFQKALAAFIQYHNASDSLQYHESDKRLVGIEAEYLLFKKKNENEIQHLQIKEQSILIIFLIALTAAAFIIMFVVFRKNKVIRKSRNVISRINTELLHQIDERQKRETEIINKTKQNELLLSEIHHRIKNNFAILVSLLEMTKKSPGKNDLHTILNEIIMRIKTMSMVHEQLYRSGNFDKIPLKDYLSSLVTIISGAFSRPGIDLKMDFTPIAVEIEKALPLGLILNEVVTNAYKHAFPGERQGWIKIVLAPIPLDGGQYQLEITDNGVGLSGHTFSEENKSMGSQIVHILTRQLEGTLQISTQKGTTVSLSFPLSV